MQHQLGYILITFLATSENTYKGLISDKRYCVIRENNITIPLNQYCKIKELLLQGKSGILALMHMSNKLLHIFIEGEILDG